MVLEEVSTEDTVDLLSEVSSLDHEFTRCPSSPQLPTKISLAMRWIQTFGTKQTQNLTVNSGRS